MCVCAQRKALRVLPAAQGTALPRPLCCRRCREHTEEGGEARPAPLLLPRPPPAPPSAPFPSRSLPGMLPGPHGQIPSARHQLPQAEPARTHTVTGTRTVRLLSATAQLHTLPALRTQAQILHHSSGVQGQGELLSGRLSTDNMQGLKSCCIEFRIL